MLPIDWPVMASEMYCEVEDGFMYARRLANTPDEILLGSGFDPGCTEVKLSGEGFWRSVEQVEQTGAPYFVYRVKLGGPVA
jgi:hypothetical protein